VAVLPFAVYIVILAFVSCTGNFTVYTYVSYPRMRFITDKAVREETSLS